MKILKKLFYRAVYKIRYLQKSQYLLNDVDNYAGLITLNPAESPVEYSIPKIIWLYWEGNLPDLVQCCIQRIQSLHPDYTVHVLNPSNVQHFCSFDFTQPVVQNATPQQRADLIRLNLIAQFGGIWLDASTMLYQKLDWIIEQVQAAQCQCFSYYRAKNTTQIQSPVLENWLMASVANNAFYQLWFDALYKAIEIGPKHYIAALKQQPNHADIFQNIGRLEYLIAYVVCQQVMRECRVSMLLINCDQNAFLYQVSNQWLKEKFALDVAIAQAPQQGPFLIKLAGKERKILTRIYAHQQYLSGSLFANFKDAMLDN